MLRVSDAGAARVCTASARGCSSQQHGSPVRASCAPICAVIWMPRPRCSRCYEPRPQESRQTCDASCACSTMVRQVSEAGRLCDGGTGVEAAEAARVPARGLGVAHVARRGREESEREALLSAQVP